jgi:hypothetical protein
LAKSQLLEFLSPSLFPFQPLNPSRISGTLPAGRRRVIVNRIASVKNRIRALLKANGLTQPLHKGPRWSVGCWSKASGGR